MNQQFSPKPGSFQNQPGGPASKPGASPSQAPATSGKATMALVLGLLSLVFSCLTAIPALIVGFLALGDIKRSQGRLGGKGMAIAGIAIGIAVPALWLVIGGILTLALVPAFGAARAAAQQVSTQNNLKQAGLAMHNYHDVYKRFPYAGTDSVNLSWRVSILPFVEQMPLHDQFDYNQAADSAVNGALVSSMPEIYGTTLFEHDSTRSPLMVPIARAGQPATEVRQPAYSIQARTAPDGNSSSVRFADMVDGTSNTIMLVLGRPEALSKSWTSTGSDYEVNPDNPAAGMYQTSNGVYLVLFADGSAQRISTSIDPVTLNNLMMRNDGNVADAFMFSE